MKKSSVPVYRIGQHCKDVPIDNIKVSSFEEKMCTATEFLENHRHDYYEIVWFRHGTGSHTIDGVDYAYRGSSLFLLSPGQVHKLNQAEKGEGYVIKFLPAIFRDQNDIDDLILNTSLFDNIQADPVITVPETQDTILEDLLAKMQIEFDADESDRDSVLGAYLKVFMMMVKRIKRHQRSTGENITDLHFHLFNRFKNSIERNYKKEHSVQTYADLLNTQTRTLNTISKKFAGKSAGQLFADRVLLEAKRSLHFDHESVKELAFDLGFEDPAYFTRFFKKHTGVSPFQFKSDTVAVKFVKVA